LIYLLDANAIIRYLAGSPQLSPQAKAIMDDPGDGNRMAVATIALVEAWDVARKKRRDFVPFDTVTRAVKTRGMIVEDLTQAIVRQLPDEWEDTRDMIILATALDLQARYGPVTIVSSDRKLRCEQTLVSCVW
jgi:PIN domain nuclease of toxin-antitoxin system